MHPYKLQILQDLTDHYPDKCIEFCDFMTDKIVAEPELVRNICFSDECSFYLNGNVNKQICRYCSNDNPYIFTEKMCTLRRSASGLVLGMTYFANGCFVCRAVNTLNICSCCNMIAYCGPNHQTVDWPKHREFCNVVSFIMKEKGLSHIYEKLHNSDQDTWCKERKRMCAIMKTGLNRDLLLHEEQMLLMPRVCFVCYDTRQESLTPCPACLCVNFCEEHLSSSQHDKDCHSLKLFRELDGKIQDPVKLKIILILIDQIVASTKFDSFSETPRSMERYLDQKITSGDRVLKQAFASNVLSMPLTLFNAVKILNLQSTSQLLFHIRCAFPDYAVWEILFHFLADLTVLTVVFLEQHDTRNIEVKLCDDCCRKGRKFVVRSEKFDYKKYAKVEHFKKPDMFVYFHAEISQDVEDGSNWQELLELLCRIGSPLVLTSVTGTKAKDVSESLRLSFWPSIYYEGVNDFGALDPLREWTDGGIGRINQYMIITKGCNKSCKAGTFSTESPLLLKKAAGRTWNPQYFYYSHVCLVCHADIISIMCKYCNMVFYCSELHRRRDWYRHKDICKVIRKLLTELGLRSIFDGELEALKKKKADPESWLEAKLSLLSKAEMEAEEKLSVSEQQMFLFPKSCFVCHECNFTKLLACKCGTILCRWHKDSHEHASFCKEYELSFLLTESEQVADPLPKFSFVYSAKEKLPESLQNFLELHLAFEKEASVSDIQKIVVAELLTKPLTLLCAMRKLERVKSQDKSTLVVHVVGSKNGENASEEFWQVFFYWMGNLDKLNVTFLGSEIKSMSFKRSYFLGHESKERTLAVQSYPMEYEEFVQTNFFVKPDIIVGYNLDIHECQVEAAVCSCKGNILEIKRLKVPFIMTSGTRERARKDHKRLSTILETPITPDFSYLNPFTSLEPMRDFETESLRYSNKFVLIYSRWMPGSAEKCDIFVKPATDLSRSSELEKKLAELLFTKFKPQPDQGQKDFSTSEQEKKAEETKEGNLNFRGKSSSVFAASSELKHMIRNFNCDPKVGLRNSESAATRNEICDAQDSRAENRLKMEAMRDSKSREAFKGLFAGNETKAFKDPEADVVVEMEIDNDPNPKMKRTTGIEISRVSESENSDKTLVKLETESEADPIGDVSHRLGNSELREQKILKDKPQSAEEEAMSRIESAESKVECEISNSNLELNDSHRREICQFVSKNSEEKKETKSHTENQFVSRSFTAEECKFQLGKAEAIKNISQLTTGSTEFVLDNSKFRQKEASNSRNIFSSVLVANSELKFMLKNFGRDLKSSRSGNTELKSKQGETSGTSNAILNFHLAKEIAKSPTTNEMESNEGLDQRINLELRTEEAQGKQSELNGGEYLKEKLQRKPTESLESEFKPEIEIGEERRRVESEDLELKISRPEDGFDELNSRRDFVSENTRFKNDDDEELLQNSETRSGPKMKFLASEMMNKFDPLKNEAFECENVPNQFLKPELNNPAESLREILPEEFEELEKVVDEESELKVEKLKNELKNEELKDDLKVGELKNELKSEELKNELRNEELKSILKDEELENGLKDEEASEFEPKLKIETLESEMLNKSADLSDNAFFPENKLNNQDENSEDKYLEEFQEKKRELKEPEDGKLLKNSETPFKSDAGKRERSLREKSPEELKVLEELPNDSEFESKLNGEADSRESVKLNLTKQDGGLEDEFLGEFQQRESELKDLEDGELLEDSETRLELWTSCVEFEASVETEDLTWKVGSEVENISNGESISAETIKKMSEPNGQNEKLKFKLPEEFLSLEKDLTPTNDDLKHLETEAKPEIHPAEDKITEDLNCKSINQGGNLEDKLLKKFSDLEMRLKDTESEELNVDKKTERESAMETVQINKIYLNHKTVLEFENLSSEKAGESEERSMNENSEDLSSEHQMESKTNTLIGDKLLLHYPLIEDSRLANDELIRENSLLREEIERLKRNEELIQSENLRLKVEIRHLREKH